MNPILQQLQRTQQSAPQSNNPMQIMQQFNQFKQQMRGKNPKAMVEDMIRTGRLSQAQFDQLKQQANQFQQFLK